VVADRFNLSELSSFVSAIRTHDPRPRIDHLV
jgi:hypothetical protein